MAQCIVCGKELTGRQSKYCSRKCTNKDYYSKNQDKNRAYHRKYYHRNRKACIASQNKYKQKHRDEIRAQQREHYREHREEILEKRKIRRYLTYHSAPTCEDCLYYETCQGKKMECEYRDGDKI